MPFIPGERLDWIPIRTDRPDDVLFTLRDEQGATVLVLSIANGGLVARRKGALHPVFHAPRRVGKYRYEWTIDGMVVDSGHVRVGYPPVRPPATQPAEQGGPAPGFTYNGGQ